MTLLGPAPTHDVALLRDDLYSVLTDTDTLGYVQRVGRVYVALAGSDLSHAVEVGQSMSWERAVELVVGT